MAALPQTDIVINCLPGNAEGFFSADLVAAMAPGSTYASVGRCNTTDEPALIAALEAGHLGGAVLDVTAIEPLPTEIRSGPCPTCCSPSTPAAASTTEDEGKVNALLRNLSRLHTGHPLENLVELSRGY